MSVVSEKLSSIATIKYLLDKIDEFAGQLFDDNKLSVSRLFEVRDLIGQIKENLERIAEILGEALKGQSD